MNAISDLLEFGITPKAIEQAYKTGTIRTLAMFYAVSLEDIETLAKRWGIGPYQEAA